MANIVISSGDLSGRGKKMQKILTLISPLKSGPAYDTVPTNQPFKGSKVIGFFDGKSPSDLKYVDWRFKTTKTGIFAMYYERWVPADINRYDTYYLDRAYFHIYELEDNRHPDTLKEFVCLHCDPNESDQEAHAGYKRVPHIHIKAAKAPIPHSHLSLGIDFSKEILESADTLFSSFQSAITLINDEILNEIP
jgi:hypothetical protein